MPQPHKNLRRDLGVFADPGFLVTIVLLLLIYGMSVHGVPLRLFS